MKRFVTTTATRPGSDPLPVMFDRLTLKAYAFAGAVPAQLAAELCEESGSPLAFYQLGGFYYLEAVEA